MTFAEYSYRTYWQRCRTELLMFLYNSRNVVGRANDVIINPYQSFKPMRHPRSILTGGVMSNVTGELGAQTCRTGLELAREVPRCK